MNTNNNCMKRICISGNIKLDKQFDCSDTVGNIKNFISLSNNVPVDSILLKCKNVVLINNQKLDSIEPKSKVLYIFSKIKIEETTEKIEEVPKLCLKNCGFYGNMKMEGMCSKCYNENIKVAIDSGESDIDSDDSDDNSYSSDSNSKDFDINQLGNEVRMAENNTKCNMCNCKLRSFSYSCKCGNNFCAIHRHDFTHNCVFLNNHKDAERNKLGDKLKSQECRPQKIRKL